MKPLRECRLYAFVDTAYLRGRAPEEVARALCDGGADLIQLRAKEAPVVEVRRLAEAVLPVTQRAGIGLVINDHPAVARELGAEFCHLGQEDFFGAGYTHVSQLPLVPSPAPMLRTERRVSSRGAPLPFPSECEIGRPGEPSADVAEGSRPGVKVGLSTAGPEQARRAIAAGADYLGVGPVFPTGTKPAARAVTLEYVRWAAENIRIPWFAIGGINLANLDEVLGAGAQRVCVVSAILGTDAPAAACRNFKERLGRAGCGS